MIPSPYVARLTLGPSAEIPRGLQLDCMRLSLFVSLSSERGEHLAGASAMLSECDLNISEKYFFLHVGRASFFVSPAEALQIHTALEPHGLHVTEQPPPVSTPLKPLAGIGTGGGL